MRRRRFRVSFWPFTAAVVAHSTASQRITVPWSHAGRPPALIPSGRKVGVVPHRHLPGYAQEGTGYHSRNLIPSRPQPWRTARAPVVGGTDRAGGLETAAADKL
ncbi:hypothetical protein BDV96DRAFT_91281 [Lophiotrema nucula]|uniref:Secreted protein n=1 Tax=Lophiotrema nucula TaxID=690887 RepID=A0A6A5Z6F8_9PLEO|nr:hypothetical protein BDV96DRAFT_91281 [Lophiotrema nucula]